MHCPKLNSRDACEVVHFPAHCLRRLAMGDINYKVWATHRKLPTMVEGFPTKSAAEWRAGELCLAGYKVEVMTLTGKIVSEQKTQ